MSVEDSGKKGNGTRVDCMERRSEDNRAGGNCDGEMSTELEALEFQRERASWAKGPREQATLDVGEGVRIGGRRVGSPTEGEAGEEDGAEA